MGRNPQNIYHLINTMHYFVNPPAPLPYLHKMEYRHQLLIKYTKCANCVKAGFFQNTFWLYSKNFQGVISILKDL